MQNDIITNEGFFARIPSLGCTEFVPNAETMLKVAAHRIHRGIPVDSQAWVPTMLGCYPVAVLQEIEQELIILEECLEELALGMPWESKRLVVRYLRAECELWIGIQEFWEYAREEFNNARENRTARDRYVRAMPSIFALARMHARVAAGLTN